MFYHFYIPGEYRIINLYAESEEKAREGMAKLGFPTDLPIYAITQ